MLMLINQTLDKSKKREAINHETPSVKFRKSKEKERAFLCKLEIPLEQIILRKV